MAGAIKGETKTNLQK